ncbi:MAG: tRNA ((37)-N6)-threonylcarbamoyltransferase complex dimerization subunit type 1 TsaB [Actinomycetota bacterium]
MILLAIDTALGTSVAVVGDDVAVEQSTTDSRSHAEHVGTFIESVLSEAELTAADVDGVVVGLGPGPFTGLRVGIAAGIAFAVGRGIPVYGVPSHDAVAMDRGDCCVVTDVRRRELAWTTYRDSVAVEGPALTTEATLTRDVNLAAFPEVRAETVSAIALARAARVRLDRGDDLSTLSPLYMRAPDATPSNGPKRVSQ